MNERPGDGLDDYLAKLAALDGRVVHVTVRRLGVRGRPTTPGRGGDDEDRIRRIAQEEIEAEKAFDRQRARVRGSS